MSMFCETLGFQWYCMYNVGVARCTFKVVKLERQIHFPLDNVFTQIKFGNCSFYRVTICSSVILIRYNLTLSWGFYCFCPLGFCFGLVLSKIEMTQHCQLAYKSLNLTSGSNLMSEPRVMYNSFFHSFFAIVFLSKILLPIMNTVQQQLPLH